MLSLDLFATQFERELREGAVDDLEYRRMNDLREKMEMLMQAYKKANTDEMRRAIMKRYNEYKAEREGYLKIREQQVPGKQDPFAYVKPEPKGIGDIQDPQTKMSQLAQKGKKGPLANVGAGLKGFLTGKEEPLDEQELGRKGIGVRNMKALQATIEKGLARTEFQFAGGQRVFADEDDSDKLADYYNGMDSAGRSNFVYNIISDPVKFVALCKQLGVSLTPVAAQQPDLPGIPGQGELPLAEKRDQKKKFKSAIAQRELEKAMAAEPTAGDPIEAFILKSIENDQAQSQQIKDLESKIQTLRPTTAPVTSTAITAPATTARVAPTMPAPTEKPAPAVAVPQATQPGPAPTAEPAPVPDVKQLPKKDQKILSRVRRIEKRLRDRVDQYQTAKALQDTTPGQLQNMQQKIDDLQAQIQSQRDQLGKTAKLQLGQDDVWDVEASIVRPAFGQIKAAAEGQIAEHGGGIGPRQHWQSLMQEGQPQDAIQRYLAIDAETDVEAVKKAIQAIHRDPALSANSKARLLSYIFALVRKHKLHIGRAYYQFLQQYMEEGWSDQGNPTPYSVYIDGREWRAYKNDEHARAVADKVRANLKRQGREQTVTIAPSQRKQVEETHDSKLELAAKEFIKGIYDPTGPIYRAAYRSFHKGQDAEAQLRKNIAQKYGVSEKDLSDAETSHRASKLAGPRRKKDVEEDFGMPGTTIPRKSVIQGYTVYFNPKTQVVSVTRGGDSEEAAIEQARVGTPSMKNFRQAADRLIDKIESDLTENIIREPKTARERDDMIDKIRRMMTQDRNPANLQIMKKDIEILQTKYRDLKEDSDSGEAVEMAIMRRMLVAHTDLIVEHGLDKVVQAIEDVAYDVGHVDEIGSSDVSGWVRQVETILGGPEALDEKWSAKYKRSINCANPKGFSQRAHCQGRKK